jgi:NAD(P)-dependent dehydrogenase (short-subunit alcohol dehydrogenase family)
MSRKLERAADGNIFFMATVLITGGTGALGVPVVEAFLADGWRVVVPWIVGGEQERLPPEAEAVEADLFDPDDVGRAVRLAASESSAPLRAVANLVGGYRGDQPVADTPIGEFEALFTLNVRPTYLVTQCALPRLVSAGGGAIVCVAAKAALEPWAGAAGYAASKAAVIALARSVAKEHGGDGVRCNVIAPTIIDTPANRASSPNAKMTPPSEVAAVVRFLCGDESAAVNGAVVSL